MKVKICGLTRAEDVRWALELGADYLGFVLAPSRRQIQLTQLAELAAGLPNAVAVMVNPSPEEVNAALCHAALVQLHGQETPEFCRRWGQRVIKALNIRSPHDLEQIPLYASHCRHVLLDSSVPGSGQTFDWSWLQGLAAPYFLAGGMDAASLERAAERCQPYGVDASSGLETAPGIKCPQRVKALIEAARRYP